MTQQQSSQLQAQMASALAACHAEWYELRPHPVQQRLISELHRFKVVPAGRRCLEAGTLVATPTGPVAIEDLQVGDSVIGFDGNNAAITMVTATWDNGEQKVWPLVSGDRKFLAATENHNLWACNERDFDKRPGRSRFSKGYERLPISALSKRHRVRREFAGDLIRGGLKSMPMAYALGAMLGNGCCRENKITTGRGQRTMKISAETSAVPARIAELAGCGYRKLHEKNYTYSIDVGRGAIDAIPLYREWAAGRYSHEKIAEWEEIDTWDRQSCMQFLAGVIDTDGSVYFKSQSKREAVINITMQAASVVECCVGIVFKYLQEQMSVYLDAREKYKNGPVWSAKTTSNQQVIRILEAIEPYLRHRAGFDCSTLVCRNVRRDRIGFTRGQPYTARTHDITVGNSTNLYCLHDGGVVTSNSGKTCRAKRKLAKTAMSNPGELLFAAAPTREHAKRIWWEDLKKLCFTPLLGADAVRESELIIRLPNGSQIHVIGLDKPERMEGIPWTGGVIDEIADVDANAWPVSIRPALSTSNPLRPGHKAWCWLIGVPEGLNHYYDLAEYARTSGDPEWALYHWESADILSPEEIEAAMRTLSARQFRQEYRARFEGATGRIYEDYDDGNVTHEEIARHEQLHWMHDFNYTPLSSAIGVRRGTGMYLLDEIVLESAVAKNTAVEFVERYKDHDNKSVIVYGDPAGQAGEKHGQVSNYTAILQTLRDAGWKVEKRVKAAAPAIRDRQNAVRARICNARGERALFCNPNRAKYAHKGLATVQVKEGSSFQEADSQYQHITTAIGYCIDYEWPVLIDTSVKRAVVVPVPSVNYYAQGMTR